MRKWQYHTQESQEVGPFPAGDHKAACYNQVSIQSWATIGSPAKRFACGPIVVRFYVLTLVPDLSDIIPQNYERRFSEILSNSKCILDEYDLFMILCKITYVLVRKGNVSLRRFLKCPKLIYDKKMIIIFFVVIYFHSPLCSNFSILRNKTSIP